MRRLLLGLAATALCTALASHAAANGASERAAAQQIAQNMKQSGILKNYRVGVRFQDGVAVLEGSVTDADQRVIAEAIARNSNGVQRVINKLAIDDQSASGRVDIEQTLATSAPEAMPARQVAETTPRQARRSAAGNMPVPFARTTGSSVQPAGYGQYNGAAGGGMQPMPMSHVPAAGGRTVSYDNPQVPGYAWPSYAANPNYAALTYPQQYSPSAWPYIGPFYPYPQVPLGWRKVTLEWDDGWWFLDFKDCKDCY